MTRRCSAISVIITLIGAGQFCDVYGADKFRDIVIGRTSRSSVLTMIGEPDYSGPVEDVPGLMADTYDRPGLYHLSYSSIVIRWTLQSKQVVDVQVYLRDPIKPGRLKELFPGAWMRTTWELERCSDPAKGEMVKSPTGTHIIWECARRGISYWPLTNTLVFSGRELVSPKPTKCK